MSLFENFCDGDKRVDDTGKRILTIGSNDNNRVATSSIRFIPERHCTVSGKAFRVGCARREEGNYEESLKKGVVEGPKERLSPAAAAPTVGSLFMVPVRRWCGTHHLFYPRASRYRTHFTFGHLFLFFPRENRS